MRIRHSNLFFVNIHKKEALQSRASHLSPFFFSLHPSEMKGTARHSQPDPRRHTRRRRPRPAKQRSVVKDHLLVLLPFLSSRSPREGYTGLVNTGAGDLVCGGGGGGGKCLRVRWLGFWRRWCQRDGRRGRGGLERRGESSSSPRQS